MKTIQILFITDLDNSYCCATYKQSTRNNRVSISGESTNRSTCIFSVANILEHYKNISSKFFSISFKNKSTFLF